MKMKQARENRLPDIDRGKVKDYLKLKFEWGNTT